MTIEQKGETTLVTQVNLSDNAHVLIKIYLEFYHGIVYIANEERHIRFTYNNQGIHLYS